MNWEVVLNLFQTAVLLIAFFGAIRTVGSEKRTMRVVFYGFAVACGLLSNFYWLAYDILRPGTRMPFAANEIGEWAMFLLLGAALNVGRKFRKTSLFMVFTALFTLANVAFWIAWSGEWIEDVLTGAAFGYFLISITERLSRDDALSRREWIALGVACFALIAMQTAIFFVPEPLGKTLDLCCYVLLFAGVLWFFVKTILGFLKKYDPAKLIGLAFAAYGWSMTTLYMSAGGFYVAAICFAILCYPLMLLALRKEEPAS